MNRIRIGVVGLNVGACVCSNIVNKEGKQYFQLSVVCDLDAHKGNRWRDEHKATVFTDYDEMLANADIEAVAVMTGPNGRAAMIRKAIRAGKHVMTTKPFEMDPDAAMQVLQEAERLKKAVFMNSPSPVPSPVISQIARWRDKYRLGEPIGYRHDIWAGYREEPDGRWYDDPNLCPAAPMLRLGIYPINEMVRIFRDPVQVHVTQSRIFTQRPTADNVQMTVLFKNGAIGSHFASFCVRDGQSCRRPLILNFENGTITSSMEPVAGETHMMTVSAMRDGRRETDHAECHDTLREYPWSVLHRTIMGENIDGLVTKEEIVNAVRILCAMRRSSQSGLPEQTSLAGA